MMSNALIACRSVTYAQRAVRLLERHGLRASMRRLPAELPASSDPQQHVGCGHAIRVRREELKQAMKLMSEAGFPSKFFFCEDENGGVFQCP